MERKGWTITTAGVVAILGAIVLNGGKLVEVATGAWLFLLKLSETALAAMPTPASPLALSGARSWVSVGASE